MANVSKRGDSYRITVSCGFDGNNKHIRKYMTYKPAAGMTPKQIEKAVQQAALEFEKKCLTGQVLDSSTRFRDFADKWFTDYAEKQLEPRTVARYKDLLVRINAALGNMKLADIQPYHLQEFYNNLAEKGIRADIKYQPAPLTANLIKESGQTMENIAEGAGVSLSVVRSCKQGRNVTLRSAEKIAAYFDKPVSELFEPGEDKGLSDKTIREHHVLLSSIFSTAVQWQVIFSNPCERVKPPKVEYKESRYLDENGAAALFEALEGEPYQYAVMIQLFVHTGLRRAELCGLSWDDIDFINKKIYVHKNSLYLPKKGIYESKTKTRRSTRVIKVSDDALEIINDYRKWQNDYKAELGDYWQESGRLFTKQDGRPIHPDTISSWFHDFVQRKQLPDVCVHSLRHTNATLMIAAGTPLKIVSDRLGHASIQTTSNIYAHQIQSADAVAADNIAEMLKKGKDSLDKSKKIG